MIKVMSADTPNKNAVILPIFDPNTVDMMIIDIRVMIIMKITIHIDNNLQVRIDLECVR